VDQLQKHAVQPDSGPVVVTGASGGVGSVAVMILHQLGYEVVAVSGKPERTEWLKQLGAADVIGREAVDDRSDRPLLSARWAGAVDTVGGNTLATVIRSTRGHGCVTACGLVGGHELSTTVYPFILRGVTLQGIDSANTSRDVSGQIWRRLGNEYRLPELDRIATQVPLDRITESVPRILRGEVAGRIVVAIGG
jgi:putative YhdH/YhfP family quinone oxidoreductase